MVSAYPTDSVGSIPITRSNNHSEGDAHRCDVASIIRSPVPSALLNRTHLVALLCLWSSLSFADYAAAPKRPIDLTGYWVLNPAMSDDPEAMLSKRQAEENERFERLRRREEQSRPRDMP